MSSVSRLTTLDHYPLFAENRPIRHTAVHPLNAPDFFCSAHNMLFNDVSLVAAPACHIFSVIFSQPALAFNLSAIPCFHTCMASCPPATPTTKIIQYFNIYMSQRTARLAGGDTHFLPPCTILIGLRFITMNLGGKYSRHR